MNIYDKRNAFSLLQKEAVLVAFRRLGELKSKAPMSQLMNADDATFFPL